MPLDRDHVSPASRVMLPFYAALNLVFGVLFVLDPQHRLDKTPALNPAQGFMPLDSWGLLWLGLATTMTAALCTHVREWYVRALAINIAAWGVWAVVLEIAVFSQPNVSFLVGAIGVVVAVASYASLRSLRAEA